jgi:hypothetical protein
VVEYNVHIWVKLLTISLILVRVELTEKDGKWWWRGERRSKKKLFMKVSEVK